MMNGTQKHQTPTTSTADAIEQLLAAWNGRDIERLLALYSDQFRGLDSAEPRGLQGLRGVENHFRHYLTAFPDLRIVARRLIAAGPHVTLIWQATGTQRGEFLHIPPTLRTVTLEGVTVFLLEDNKIVTSTTVWDVAGWLREVGLLPKL